jgi:hypothetical protein
MPLQKVYYYQPSVLTTTDYSGLVTTQPSAARHILYEQTTGYVGPIPKIRPKPVHAFNTYNDDLTFYFEDRRVRSDGKERVIQGSALARVPHSPTFDPPYNFDGVYNDALEKLNSQTRGDLDVVVDLAEAHQTRAMFSATKRVEDYTKVFMRRFTTVKAAANHWLEYTYGVKPLLNTVFGLAEENIRIVLNQIEHFRVRATDNSYRPKTVVINDIWGLESYPVVGGKFKISCTLGMDMSSNTFDFVRFYTLNPVSLAWELTPYSFVVDWFLNVGGYLRNLETSLLYGGRFKSGYRTNLFAYDGIAQSYFDYTKAGFNPGGFQRTESRFKGSSMSRSLLSSYPAPTLPRFEAKLGASRLLSAASLLAGFLGRR